MIGGATHADPIAADMAEALAGLPEREPYPVEALPDSIRAAVDEVLDAVQCPPALAGMSALAVLSTAAQAHVDVVRDEALDGPTSLYGLAIAESGERKTSTDRLFASVLRDWERRALAEAQPVLDANRAAHAAWEARRAGLTDAIKAAARKLRDAPQAERDLIAHMAAQPVAVRAPALLQTDATPEALAWALHSGWPSAALMTAEGGLVLGGYGMGRESIMRNLALYNALWDGAEHRVARRTQPSYLLAGRRLTLWVQVQPAALAQYLADNGPLARGTGWLARCLIARPESTQGTRLYRPPAAGQPALARYHARIAALLDERLPMDGDRLRPRQVWLRGAARVQWVRYHDAVECELAAGGELAAVRDAGAKGADNAARIAALFAVYEGRGEVGAEDIDRGAALVSWHLAEARRVLALGRSEARRSDADLLVACVAERAERAETTCRRDVQNAGPVRLRVGTRLDAATAAAEAAGRLVIAADGTMTAVGTINGAG